MAYMWDEFNIKPFPAETIVYRDGVYMPDLSTLADGPIDKKYDMPVHIIYVGEIAGNCRLNVDVLVQNQPVVISVHVKNKKPAFLHIFIKNTGPDSHVTGNVILINDDNLRYECVCEHRAGNTAILIKNRILAGKNSISKLWGTAKIYKNCPACASDVSFVAMADAGARIEFLPTQQIMSVPKSAEHSASIYRLLPGQIEYLRTGGISTADIEKIKREAFISMNNEK